MHKYLNSLHHTLKYPLPKYPPPFKHKLIHLLPKPVYIWGKLVHALGKPVYVEPKSVYVLGELVYKKGKLV